MKKSDATELLGNSATAAAEAIGITPQAYNQWPEILPARLRDRVQAALARKLNVLPPQATDASVDRQLSPEQVQP